MSYIGNQPTTVAFLVDTFSGDGSDTTFTLSQAPANTSSILVAVSGVLQDPAGYSVSGTTLTFSAAPPSGSSSISVRFLGIPASGVTTTAYRTVTEFTATSGQTTFSVPSYTVGYIDMYRNGVMLGTADFTASSGTSVVLAAGATAGDLIRTESFYVSSVLNAIPAVANAVTTSYINDGAVTKAKMAASGAWAPTGTVLQVVQASTSTQTLVANSTTFTATNLTASITPTSASSKILVLIVAGSYIQRIGTSLADFGMGYAIYRNSTQVFADAQAYNGFYISTNTANVIDNVRSHVSTNYLDSPATTSSTTYTLYINSYQGNGAIGTSSVPSTITLMEIAG